MADEPVEEEAAPDEAAAGEEGAGEGAAEKKKGGGFKLGPGAVKILKMSLQYLLVAIIAFVVALCTGGGGGEKGTGSAQQDIQKTDPVTGDVFVSKSAGADWTMDEMIINTSDEDSQHLVKCQIVVSYEPLDQFILEELSKRKTQIHAEFRKIIGGKKFMEINTIKKQDRLEEELLTRVQTIVNRAGIIAIYLKEFTVH